jgi:hypothetical protein
VTHASASQVLPWTSPIHVATFLPSYHTALLLPNSLCCFLTALQEKARRLRADVVKHLFKSDGATFAPLRRAKVVLCGQGRVGKTSLRKALTGATFEANEPSTAGAHVTCALLRVEANQADGEWTIHEHGHSDCEGEAECAYIKGRYGTDGSAWAARNRGKKKKEHSRDGIEKTVEAAVQKPTAADADAQQDRISAGVTDAQDDESHSGAWIHHCV